MSGPGTAGLERRLRQAARVSDEDAAAAAARLADRADADGVLEVGYATIDTPLGPMLLAATGLGLVRVALPRETFDDVLGELAERVSPRLLERAGRVDAARRELDEYFSGDRTSFDLPLDRRLISGPFRASILEAASEVPYGVAITYAEVAARAGSPRAHRAAGSALGTNPIPIVIPCHRVVRAGGAIGNYGGGPEVKRFLLRHEGWLQED
ncbi:MAG: methylated-DNA--[protein]-cysteine S-methyltransferase [Solirubrobacterales bacterium]